MRGLMNKLAGFLGRRRRWVLAAWLVIVVAALPFAAKQTDHLTGGGFDVPGSQSKAVSDALQSEFGAKADGIAVLLEAEPGATRRSGGPRSAGCGARSPSSKGSTLPPAAPRRRAGRLAAEGTPCCRCAATAPPTS